MSKNSINEKSIKSIKLTQTENGALSYDSTGSACVNFFFKVVRDTSETELIKLLEQSHNENPHDTIKLVFQLRDARGGKGERQQFLRCIRWYVANGYEKTILSLISSIPYFGRWKDLLELLDIGGNINEFVFRTFANILDKDRTRFLQKKSTSLCAKWAPSEGGEYDKKYKAASKIAKYMGITMKQYRKEYLAPLRAYSNTTEVWMCSQQWDKIKYETVASYCMHKNKNTFIKHDEERFNKYINAIKSSEHKINASQLFPHELIAHYIRPGTLKTKNTEIDNIVEAQWKELVKHCKQNESISMGRCLPVCDVSGSMTRNNLSKSSPTPINVCVGMGLLLSELAEHPFKNQIITFHDNPKLCSIEGTSLKDKIDKVCALPWGMNTNLEKVFEMILYKCKQYNLTEDQCPETIIVFSDMQFDKCVIGGNSSGNITNYDAIKSKYMRAGYNMPKIIFWNLSGNTQDFPVMCYKNQTALVSGYSPSLLKLFMDENDINPYKIMRKAIDDKRYSCVQFIN
jgi:hypothetical protein